MPLSGFQNGARVGVPSPGPGSIPQGFSPSVRLERISRDALHIFFLGSARCVHTLGDDLGERCTSVAASKAALGEDVPRFLCMDLAGCSAKVWASDNTGTGGQLRSRFATRATAVYSRYMIQSYKHTCKKRSTKLGRGMPQPFSSALVLPTVGWYNLHSLPDERGEGGWGDIGFRLCPSALPTLDYLI